MAQINNVRFKADTTAYPISYNNRYTPPMPENTMDDMFLPQDMANKKASKKEKNKERWYKTSVVAQVGMAVAFGIMALGTAVGLYKQLGKGGLSKLKFEDIAKKENFPKLEDDCVNPKVREFIKTLKDRGDFNENICKYSGSKAPEQFMLMYGPSGTGKTFSAKLMAKEIGAEYAEVQFADVSSPYIGQTSVEIKNVFKDLASKAEKNPQKKYLVAFNEIDALLVPREKCGSNNLHLAENRTAFLNGLDELSKFKNVKIVGTTNVDPKSGNLDAASLSRFGNMLKIDLPNAKELVASLKFHLKGSEAVKTHKFFENNEKEIEKFAQELVEKRYSQRDIEKIAELAQTKFGIAIKDSKDMASEKFDIKYLKEAVEAKGSTTGTINVNDAPEWMKYFNQQPTEAKVEGKKGLFDWIRSIFSRN